ncbi:unnamed protein product [Nyctereutes procyonoides]|uniref:Vomeronasal type-1 receptor n=1 Tax=Nyctereutes procyonoides TaxID=34880 RepID=A0A811YDJ9_NYCPR|nr:unnamed protein product [Nyctereutes procyonoides]
MFSSNVIIGILFLSQTCIGVSGNSLLLLVYVYISLIDTCQKKTKGYILIHLAFCNVIIIVRRGIPEVLFSLGIKYVLDDAGCKAVIFMYRVARGLPITSTCLLSISQAITISPNKYILLRLKPKLSNLIVSFFLFFWVLNILFNIKIIGNVLAPKNATCLRGGFPLKYCITEATDVAFVSIILTSDILFMVWTSVYMVTPLHRHQKNVQGWHKSKKTKKLSLENRATQTILCLVMCFVFFYLVNSILTLHLFFVHPKDFNQQSISVFSSSCHSTICHLVLMNSDSRIFKVLWPLTKRRKWPQKYILMDYTQNLYVALKEEQNSPLSW